ncbi:hypothetical protein B0I35DRAFT_134525 [Stachybotrys elegans]|uniref:Uncharacterized protein n=1 Tax=Stachybotrys elegans TaxID=80388 RepID=A0A8K0T4P3_9HYPO|nr:hypothetical protein B0I35DRAFT_134525 [Stachybotrys elegans]
MGKGRGDLYIRQHGNRRPNTLAYLVLLLLFATPTWCCHFLPSLLCFAAAAWKKEELKKVEKDGHWGAVSHGCPGGNGFLSMRLTLYVVIRVSGRFLFLHYIHVTIIGPHQVVHSASRTGTSFLLAPRAKKREAAGVEETEFGTCSGSHCYNTISVSSVSVYSFYYGLSVQCTVGPVSQCRSSCAYASR